MPKSQSKKTQNLSAVTEARLEKLLSEQTSVILKATNQKIDGVKKDVEQLLADQANVILEAVDEQMDKKMDQKLDPVINKLDVILGEVQKHREEDVIGAEQLRRHEDQLQDHAVRQEISTQYWNYVAHKVNTFEQTELWAIPGRTLEK